VAKPLWTMTKLSTKLALQERFVKYTLLTKILRAFYEAMPVNIKIRLIASSFYPSFHVGF
jgi:hypothetical protein